MRENAAVAVPPTTRVRGLSTFVPPIRQATVSAATMPITAPTANQVARLRTIARAIEAKRRRGAAACLAGSAPGSAGVSAGELQDPRQAVANAGASA